MLLSLAGAETAGGMVVWVAVEEKALANKKWRGVGKEMVAMVLILGSGERETDEEKEEEQGIVANFNV